MQPENLRDQQFSLIRVLAVILLVVVPVMYVVLAYTLATKRPMPVNPQPVVLYALLGIALIQAALALPLLTTFMLRHPRNLSSPKGPTTPAVALIIVRMAVIETIFLFGLVYFMISGDLNPLVYFYAIGALAAALNWPTRERFEEYANTLEGK